jgi:hypothetical protein
MTDVSLPDEDAQQPLDVALTSHGERLAPLVRVSPVEVDAVPSSDLNRDFDELIAIIELAKVAAYQAVNRDASVLRHLPGP